MGESRILRPAFLAIGPVEKGRSRVQDYFYTMKSPFPSEITLIGLSSGLPNQILAMNRKGYQINERKVNALVEYDPLLFVMGVIMIRQHGCKIRYVDFFSLPFIGHFSALLILFPSS